MKWGGFRAFVRTGGGFCVRSRRGWEMTALVPALRALPPGLVLDGELVAIEEGIAYFAAVCARLLNRDRTIPLTYIVFDLLAVAGESLVDRPYGERRERLEALRLPPVCVVNERFQDGLALWDVVVERV